MPKTRSQSRAVAAPPPPEPPQESKYWQRKQCRLRNKVWDPVTGDCRPYKRCKKGYKKNRRTGMCVRKGQWRTLVTRDGNTVKFFARAGMNKEQYLHKKRTIHGRHLCLNVGGRPWYKKGKVRCARGPLVSRK